MIIVVCLYNCIYVLQTTVLLDEAKIREDARHVQHKCLEKEHVALKEENKKVQQTLELPVHSADSCYFGLHEYVVYLFPLNLCMYLYSLRLQWKTGRKNIES